MKVKFEDLQEKSTAINVVEVYRKDRDNAVIRYKFAGQELSFSCTKKEFEEIEFNKSRDKIKLPDFLEVKTNSVGKMYLARKSSEDAKSDGEDW